MNGTPSYRGCTVASLRFLAHARVLIDSFLEHNPDAGFSLLYLGETGAETADRAAALGLDPRTEVLEPVDLVGPDELARLGLMYDAQGLAGAMKTRLLRHLVGTWSATTILIDADICVYGSLAPIAERAERSQVVLTPHLQRPLLEAERPPLFAGAFNSGFIAVSVAGAPLLDWWSERTARHCVFSPSEGLVWEQSWLGLAPTFFPAEVLRDPGVNAMTRDLLDGDIGEAAGESTLRGSPLRCFHFSGPYDPHSPEYLLAVAASGPDVVMRPEDAPPGAQLAWLSLRRRPGAARMSREYAARLLAAGFDQVTKAPAFFSALPDGTAIHPAMRHAYRSALIDAEENGRPPPPNPFTGGSTVAFMNWLASPPDPEAGEYGLSRFLLAVWSSYGGAASVFPRVPGPDATAFVGWASGRLRRERALQPPAALLPSVRPGLAAAGVLEEVRRELSSIKGSRSWRLTEAPRRLAARARRRPSGPAEPGPAPMVTVRLLRSFANAYPQARFVEIGANDGRRVDPLSPFIAGRDWTGVMVEPVPYLFDRLRANFEENPRVAVEHAAVAEREETRPFFYLSEEADARSSKDPWWYDAIGSFDREHLVKHANEISDFEARLRRIDVPCLTVAGLCAKHGLGNPDLILIDAEGYDAEIVASIDFEATRPRLLIYEHHHLGEGVRSACEERLRGLGYALLAEGLDTWCLDTRISDGLSRSWGGLIGAVQPRG